MPLRPWFTHMWAHPIFHSSPRGRTGRVRGGNRSYPKGMKQLLSEEQQGLLSLEKGWRGRENRWLKYRSLRSKATRSERAVVKLFTNYSSRGTEHRRWRQQDPDTNQSQEVVCLAVGRKPWKYFWQRVLKSQKVSSGFNGRLDMLWRRDLLGVSKQRNHERLRKAHEWEIIGWWDTSCEKYCIRLFCFYRSLHVSLWALMEKNNWARRAFQSYDP